MESSQEMLSGQLAQGPCRQARSTGKGSLPHLESLSAPTALTLGLRAARLEGSFLSRCTPSLSEMERSNEPEDLPEPGLIRPSGEEWMVNFMQSDQVLHSVGNQLEDTPTFLVSWQKPFEMHAHNCN